MLDIFRNRYFLSIIILCFSLTVACSDDSSGDDSSDEIGLSGQLTDSTTGDPLANASLSLSGSLEAKPGPVAKNGTTTTDDLGFYFLLVPKGSFTHTITVTDSEGNSLGSIAITITLTEGDDYTVDPVDTSNAEGVAASIPSVTTNVSGGNTAGADVDIDGTYSPDLLLEAGNEQMTMNMGDNLVISNYRIIFGELRNSFFKKDASVMSVPLAGGKLTLVFKCDYSDGADIVIECSGENVEVDEGQIIDRITLTLTQTGTGTTVPAGNGDLQSITQTYSAKFQDGNPSTTGHIWSNGNSFAMDPDGETSNPTADLTGLYMGYNASDNVLAVLFSAGAGITDPTISYRLTLRNNVYSEILFDLYYDSSMNLQFQYRINDGDHQMVPTGGAGILNEFAEFWVDLDSLGIDVSQLQDMEVHLVTRSEDDGDDDLDSIYPFKHIDLN